jgi:hypothetical protein
MTTGYARNGDDQYGYHKMQLRNRIISIAETDLVTKKECNSNKSNSDCIYNIRYHYFSPFLIILRIYYQERGKDAMIKK